MALTPDQEAQLANIRTPLGNEEELRRKMRAALEAKNAKDTQLTALGNKDELANLSRQGLMDAQGRKAPQAAGTQVGAVQGYGGATIDQAAQNQVRASQLALADRLGQIGSGQVMGAGQMAARREGNRAIAQQQALARMGRGGNASLAAAGAASNTANIGINTAGQAAQAQAQDAQIANQTRAQILDSTRGQDIGVATSQAGLKQAAGLATMDAANQRVFQQAGLDQATSLANAQLKLQQMGMNDQAALAYLSQLYQVSAAELQARIALETRQQMAASGQSTGRSLLGGALVAGGTILGGIYGGPAGAAAGGAAGGAVNNSV